MRAGIEIGARENLGPSVGIHYRFGLHDILDRQKEYPDATSIEFLSARFEFYPQSSRMILDELVLARILRLPPISKKWEELSFKLELGGRTVREASCAGCFAPNAAAGIGGTVEPFGSSLFALFLLMELELAGSPAYSGFPIKPSVGPRAGARFRIRPWLNGWLYGLYRYQMDPLDTLILDFGTEWRLSLGPDWALNARVSRLGSGWEGSIGALAYF